MRVLRLCVILVVGVGSLCATEHAVKTAAELQALATRLAPGDVVLLANGEWRDQAVVFRARGTAQQPITLRAAAAGGAILVGNSTLVIDGEWLVVSGVVVRDGAGPAEGIALRGQHNRLTECAILGGTYKHCLRVFGTNNRVDHCAFEGKTSQEPTLQIESEPEGPNHHQVDHNYFGYRAPLGRNGGETIRVGYSGQSMNVSRTTVELNLFERCDGEIEIISSKSCENVYRFNTFLDCAGMLTLRHGNRCVVDGNFFLGHRKKDSGGVRVIGEDHVIVNNYIEEVDRGAFWITAGVPDSELNQYYVAKRCTIAFNTVVDSAGPCLDLSNGLGGSGRTLKPEAITIANNVFSVGAKGRLLMGDEGANWRWLGNLAANAADPGHAGLRVTDLKLVRVKDGRWRPAEGSAVVGAAEGDFATVAVDIDGQPRAARKDVGCDQSSPAPITRRPLTRADVGPGWMR